MKLARKSTGKCSRDLPRKQTLPPPPANLTFQTETKPESQPYLPLSNRERHVTSSDIPRAARRTYVFLTSPPPKPSFLLLLSLSLSLSLASSPSTTTLSSSTTRFINNTEQEQRRIGVILFSNQRRANPAAAVAGRWGPPIGRWWGSAWRRKGGGAASNAAPPPRPCGAAARPGPGLYATLAESGTGRRGGRILGWT